MFAFSMLTTYFVSNVPQAMVVLASVGIPWAASMWIPYALVGEFVATKDEKAIAANADIRPIDNLDIEEVIAESSSSASENTLLPSLDEEIKSKDDNSRMEDNEEEEEEEEEFDAGTILGIHNMYIVFPQFVISLISSAIFSVVEARQRLHDGEGDEGVAGDVGIVLRFGGLMAIVAAILSRNLVRIPITGK